MTTDRTVHLQACLERLRRGEPDARKELVAAACQRLEEMTREMLRGYPRLKRWEQTGDVLQNAVLRLDRALQNVTPPSLRDFYRLATLQIRRELIDLSRHYYGPRGQGRLHASNAEASTSGSQPPTYEQADSSDAPDRLAVWTEFHRQVEALPEEEREVFELVWYQDLKYTEAAVVLQVSDWTVRQRYQAALRRLHALTGGNVPGI
jgi:RNA polymerase sigma-70 factor (ECF subfamily)